MALRPTLSALEFCEAIAGATRARYNDQYFVAGGDAVLRKGLFIRMCRARATLLDVDADVNVASLAKASCLSRSQFIVRYRSAFGDTPHQTRMRARIDTAKRLLATSTLTVTEVCVAVGFSSLGSFSHLFRRRCGESPAGFKARLAIADEPSRTTSVAPHCMTLLTAALAEESYFSRSAQAREPVESRR